jgi:hypothetical protein
VSRARARQLALAAVALVAVAVAARADDRVVFHEGGDVRGVVESQDDDTVVIRVGTERRRYPRRLVLRVDLDPALRTKAPTPGAAASPDASNAKTPAPESSARPAAAEPQAPTTLTSADRELLRQVETGSAAEREIALAAIGAAWPRTKPLFDTMVAHPTVAVRLAATALLGDGRVPAPLPYVSELLSDTAPSVRRTATRLVRTLRLTTLESRILAKLADADRAVRAEAIRTLEEIASPASLQTLVDQWYLEADLSLRPRFLRVLRKVTGEDHGEDVDKWREAVERARRRAEDAKSAAPAPAAPR